MTEEPEEKKDDAEAKLPAAEAAEEAPVGEEAKIEGLECEVSDAGPCKVEAKVRIPKEALTKELTKTFDELTPNAVVPGFRRGHAPRRLVERHFQSTVLDDVKRLLVVRSWDQVKTENELHPIGEPDLSDDNIKYDEEKGVSYALTVEVAPRFDIKDYKGLELTRPSTKMDDEEVSRTLENLRRRNAILEPVENDATMQDDVPVVDFDIKVDDQVVQSVSEQEISLGPDNWLRGLDPELWKDLLGRKPGESVAKSVLLPKTYQKEEYRGKEARVMVTIKDIKRPRLPELNDDFARDMLYENLAELEKEVRQRLGASKEREAKQELSRQVKDKLLDMVSFELPEEMLKRTTEGAINRQRLSLAYRGVARDEIEKAARQIAEGTQQMTERDMRVYFILQQIADKEDVSVGESELERRIQLLAQLEGQRPARFRESLRHEGRLELLRSEMRDEKTIELLISQAKIKDQESVPPGKAKETGRSGK
jgi:trigger factor